MKGKRCMRCMNNRGSTLVEIIVSVLIVGIVFVPLLMGLTTALKANAKSEEILRAETVAANCVEAAKTYGVAGFATVPTGALAATGVSGTNPVTITGISEGLKTYSATVQFEETGFESDNLNFRSITGAYAVPVSQSIDTTRLAALRAQAGVFDGTVDIPISQDMEDLVHFKQTVITVDKFTTGANTGKYYIETRVDYLVRNTDGSGHEYFNHGGGDYFNSMDTSPDVKICDTDVPDRLLIYYSPLQSSATLNSGSDKEFIIIKNLTGEEINAYIFVNGIDMAFREDTLGYVDDKPTGSKMIVGIMTDGANPARETNVYATTNLSGYTALYSTEQDDLERIFDDADEVLDGFTEINTVKHGSGLGLIENSNGKKLYKVTVNVKDLSGAVVATKEAMIIE